MVISHRKLDNETTVIGAGNLEVAHVEHRNIVGHKRMIEPEQRQSSRVRPAHALAPLFVRVTKAKVDQRSVGRMQVARVQVTDQCQRSRALLDDRFEGSDLCTPRRDHARGARRLRMQCDDAKRFIADHNVDRMNPATRRTILVLVQDREFGETAEPIPAPLYGWSAW